MKTAQILIVGDEILSGRTADTNSAFLARELSLLGFRTLSVSVLPDNVVVLAQWIHKHHGLSDFVFVCGGIGGTPDDVTREAVARGLGLPLVRHLAAEKLLRDYYGDRANPERLSMADLPAGADLIENKISLAPGIKIQNIYVFAGIPKILYSMFESIKNDLRDLSSPLFEEEINLHVGEGDIAAFMKLINKEFPLLELGSYPAVEPGRGYRTQLVFKSIDRKVVDQAVQRFHQLADSVLKKS